jgi:hypothetical protein
MREAGMQVAWDGFGNVVALVVSLGEFGILFVLPLWMQSVHGLDPLSTGVILASLAVGTLTSGGAARHVSALMGPTQVVRLGMALEIVGIVHPDEYFYADAPTDAESLVTISAEQLEQVWGVNLLPGFLVLTEQTPAPVGYPEPVPPTVQTGDVAFPLQNFFYAIQWWLFALFAVVVYLRWLWMDAKPELHEAV